MEEVETRGYVNVYTFVKKRQPSHSLGTHLWVAKMVIVLGRHFHFLQILTSLLLELTNVAMMDHQDMSIFILLMRMGINL